MNTIEPSVLQSRIMTIVFAAALVTVIVMIVALSRMAPLEKTQVFFLTTSPRDNVEISISSYAPDENNMEIYKENFIKEYVKARNEIVPNIDFMRSKWAADSEGSVFLFSTPDVYAAFQDTQMWTALMNDTPDFELRCPVEFKNIAPRGPDAYAVNFRYFCTNNNGQTTEKDYTIMLRLEFAQDLKWRDRLENPLGVRVSEYSIESGNGDPLNFINWGT